MNGKTIHLGTLTQTCCDLPTFIAGFCAMCGAAAKEQTMTSTIPQIEAIETLGSMDNLTPIDDEE